MLKQFQVQYNFLLQSLLQPLDLLKDLLKMLHESDYIVAREFNAKKKFDGSRLYEDRGEVIINCQMIGKIKPFFE